MIKINNILECEKHLDCIDAVIFDLDDTLYSEKDYVKSGYSAIAEKFPQVSGMASKLWEAFEKKLPAIDTVLEREGILTDGAKKLALETYRFHNPVIKLYPGVRALLSGLKKNKKIGLITDGRPEGQRAKIRALEINDFFDCIIITDELGGVEFRKPCDKAFRIMQKELNVPFEKMAYIGDNLKKDFISPDKLDMRSIYFCNFEGLYN